MYVICLTIFKQTGEQHMNFLKALLLVIFTFRLIADGAVLLGKEEIVKVSAEEDEAKNEKSKEHEKKYDDEDKWYIAEGRHCLSNACNRAVLPKLSNLKLYCSFIDKPQTPPPDPKFSYN